MRTATKIREGWPFAAVTAAGIAVFFIVRLLLPTGESALPPLPIGAEPPSPVFSVALPASPTAPRPTTVEPGEDVVVVALPVSRPVVVAPKAPAKAVARPKARVATKPKPAPTTAPVAPAPAPAPAPEPEPEPVR